MENKTLLQARLLNDLESYVLVHIPVTTCQSTTSKEHGHHDIDHVTPRFVCFEYFKARFALTTRRH